MSETKSDSGESQRDGPHVKSVSPSTARYLAAIYRFTGTSDDSSTVNEISEFLNVAPASTSERVSSLVDEGLVEHESYGGVTLTEEGARLARQIEWRRCVVRTFFGDQLSAPVDETQALSIGLTLPHEGITRMGRLVDHPCEERCRGESQPREFCAM